MVETTSSTKDLLRIVTGTSGMVILLIVLNKHTFFRILLGFTLLARLSGSGMDPVAKI